MAPPRRCRQRRRLDRRLFAFEPVADVGPPQAGAAEREDAGGEGGADEGDAHRHPGRGLDAGGRVGADGFGEVEQERCREEGGNPAQQLDQGDDAGQLPGGQREAGDEEGGETEAPTPSPTPPEPRRTRASPPVAAPVRTAPAPPRTSRPEKARTGTKRMKKRAPKSTAVRIAPPNSG
jgi:hypothetical protein